MQQPHPILEQHYQNEQEKRAYLKRIFDTTAKHYDRAVSWGSFGMGDDYRCQAMIRAGLQPGMRVLDVGCGTGLTTAAIARAMEGRGEITAVDPSEGMLEQARKRAPMANFHLGSAAATGMADASFDMVIMGYALRHVEGLDVAFAEYTRVLRPGGIVLLLELTKPERAPIRGVAMKLYFKYLLPNLTYLLSGFDREARKMMAYYWETIDAVVPPASILDALRHAGFEGIRRKVRYTICSEYVGRKPATTGGNFVKKL